ncbi:MAG: nucleotidyl transferase AbiEii/AbiGii toxin family protein [Deltaproteobacteria bacterium]|nr:nucleotidyl transferase AbiEii/AbiGii toxin family protein [Deltaproteobacteria bacterium]
MYSPLQQRELFHLAFLRFFARRVRPDSYALKGGVNLRFFYQSPRYSEDMDLDIRQIPLHQIKKIVMDILNSKTLSTILKPFQIESIRPPDIQKAKQTETVQRFKVHLITNAGEDLFTKIEFSRRSLHQGAGQDAVDHSILFSYKQPPLIVSHYPASVAVMQKIEALLGRPDIQARDIFDIFILQPQVEAKKLEAIPQTFSKEKREAVRCRLNAIDYKMFRNAVCAYLSEQDRAYYDHPKIWETILRKAGAILV